MKDEFIRGVHIFIFFVIGLMIGLGVGKNAQEDHTPTENRIPTEKQFMEALDKLAKPAQEIYYIIPGKKVTFVNRETQETYKISFPEGNN